MGYVFEITGSSMWVAAARPFECFYQTVLNDSRISKKLLSNERYHLIGSEFGNNDQLWPLRYEKIASQTFTIDDESVEFEVWFS